MTCPPYPLHKRKKGGGGGTEVTLHRFIGDGEREKKKEGRDDIAIIYERERDWGEPSRKKSPMPSCIREKEGETAASNCPFYEGKKGKKPPMANRSFKKKKKATSSMNNTHPLKKGEEKKKETSTDRYRSPRSHPKFRKEEKEEARYRLG